MKLPESPPLTGDDASSQFWRELEAKLLPLEDHYLHWEHLRVKQIPIQNVNHKQWWQLVKAKRRARRQTLPFTDRQARAFYWVFDDRLMKKLSQIERCLTLTLPPSRDIGWQANAYIDEAIGSAQLSGIKIVDSVAQELLRAGRPIENENERTILNYYHVLSTIVQQPIVSNGGLQSSIAGLVQDLVIPPLSSEQDKKLQLLCEFADQDVDSFIGFMHPILKAIIVHFILSNDELFANASTGVARALFYQQVINADYFAMQSISISQQLVQDWQAYQRAFLFTYTDDNDMTYFLMQQLDNLLMAIKRFIAASKLSAKGYVEKTAALNSRQRFILAEMQAHPQWQYRIAAVQHRFRITYETARTDLLGLVQKGFVVQRKIAKAFVYRVKQ